MDESPPQNVQNISRLSISLSKIIKTPERLIFAIAPPTQCGPMSSPNPSEDRNSVTCVHSCTMMTSNVKKMNAAELDIRWRIALYYTLHHGSVLEIDHLSWLDHLSSTGSELAAPLGSQKSGLSQDSTLTQILSNGVLALDNTNTNKSL